MNVTSPTKHRAGLLLLWAIAIAFYFQYKAPISMRADWTHDDLMNGYRAFETPWAKIFSEIVFFWQPSVLFRPIGELLYKIGFDAFGFQAWPWRSFVSVVLVLNAFILGHVATRMTGSLAYGLAATAIAAFHTNWLHLYLNTGTIFEILSFTFVYAGLACYVEFHNRRWVLLPTALLFILGIDSKESAIVLPVLLVLYDLLWHKRIDWKLCVLFGAISLGFIFGRVLGPGGLSSIGQYQPVYSLATYLDRFRNYFGALILWQQVQLWQALLLAAAPALLCRNRMSIFASLIFPVAILPLAFVPERGLDGVYVACAGLALAVPCLLLLLPKEPMRLAGAVLLFAALFQWMPARRDFEGADREYDTIRRFHQTLKIAAPTLPRDSQIRFVNEPFQPEFESWASIFITRLLYRDASIVVVAPNNPHTKDYPVDRDFAVFDWLDNRVVRVR